MVPIQPLPKKLRRLPLETAIIGLLALLYLPLLWYWTGGWLNKSISIQHEYFSHGLLGIPLALYLVWEHRRRWHELPDQTQLIGWPLFGAALVFYSSGLTDLMNLSLPLMLASLCLLLKGSAGLRLQAFPLLLIGLATPTQLPYLIEPYILPLQEFIAAAAGFLLLHLGVDVQVHEIYLTVNDRLVEVAPHCAGLKMLFTSLYMGLILTYWTGLNRSTLRTSLFFASIVTISVTGNIIRNTVLTFFHGNGMDGAFDWLHESWGGDVYSAAMLGSLVVMVQLIQRYVPPSLTLQAHLQTPNLQAFDVSETTAGDRPPHDF